MPSVSAHVAATLARHVDQVFGVMGNGNAYFLDALEREAAVPYTAMRHEAGAVVAADAYYRASGRLAAATATYGAGFTNTLTALAEAVQAHIPLVLVVGDEPTSGPRPWDVDQIALASAVGARTYTVGRADAAATTAIAVEHALTYRVPTVLAIPYDVATREAGPVPAAPDPALPAPLAPRRAVRARGDRARPPRSLAARAALPAGRPRRLARRRGRGARRARRRDRRAHRVHRARPRRLPRRPLRPRRDRRLRRRRRDGAHPDGRRRRRLRGVPQPVHDAVRRAVRAGHPRDPGGRRARPRRTRTSALTCAATRGRGRRGARRASWRRSARAPSGWRESVDLAAAPRRRARRRPRARTAASTRARVAGAHRRAAARGPRRRLRRRPLHRLGEHVLAGRVARPA